LTHSPLDVIFSPAAARKRLRKRPNGPAESVPLVQRSSVLIVERSGEIRDVLRTALQRRGFQIYEASRADLGLELARRHQPNLVVIDLDEQPADTEELSSEFSQSASDEPTPVIVLGTVRRPIANAGQFIAKPYHYQPLISKIEELLQAPSYPPAERK
jgi:two-component system phosphate regulon response regulator PhoB